MRVGFAGFGSCLLGEEEEYGVMCIVYACVSSLYCCMWLLCWC